MSTTTSILWIATVPTRSPFTAVASSPEEAVRLACTAALAWLRSRGVREHRNIADVQEYFGVSAYACWMNGAVNVDVTEHKQPSLSR